MALHRPSTRSRACRLALVAGIAAAGLLGAPIRARAQTAPTIVGSLANFDVVNETEGEKEGFEIQLEGLEPNDITRVFGQSGSMNATVRLVSEDQTHELNARLLLNQCDGVLVLWEKV